METIVVLGIFQSTPDDTGTTLVLYVCVRTRAFHAYTT